MRHKPNIKKDIFVTRTVVHESEVSDLDMLFKESFGYDYENDNSDFWLVDNSPELDNNGELIEVDKMIATLRYMKEKGATHVQVMNHMDHHAYEYLGVKIEKSTDEEIEDFISKVDRKTDAELAIQAHEDAIERIKKKYNDSLKK